MLMLLLIGIVLRSGSVFAAEVAGPAFRAPGIGRIDHLKAAFLLNIARFVSWPDAIQRNQDAPLYLCLYRSNSLQPAIENISEKSAYRHPIEVILIRTLNEIASCNILFIGPSDLEAFQQEAAPMPNPPVLTIADLTKRNSMRAEPVSVHVHLVPSESRIGFEVNLDKLRRSGLWMSSKLLKLARIIGGAD